MRDTWIEEVTKVSGGRTRINIFFVFAIAHHQYTELQNISRESEIHQDILVLDVEDDYRMITFKVLNFMSLYLLKCYESRNSPANINPNLPIFGKMNDDVVINPHIFMKMVMILSKHKSESFVAGNQFFDPQWRPERSPPARDYVPSELFPSEFWWEFFSGILFFMNPEAVRMIFEYARCLPALMALEDPELTGVLRVKLNISGIAFNEHYHFTYFVDKLLNATKSLNEIQKYKEKGIFHQVPAMSFEQYDKLWNFMKFNNFF